jgi:hypothetical protein
LDALAHASGYLLEADTISTDPARQNRPMHNSESIAVVLASILRRSIRLPRIQVVLQYQVERLNFGPRPRSFTQELQTRFNAWVLCEAANGDYPAHFFPAVMRDEQFEHFLQGNAM